MPISMDDAERRRFLTDATAARERVEAALAGLMRDRDAIEKELQEGRRADLFKHVTGKSSLDRAVDEAKRTLDSLERAIDDVRKNGILDDGHSLVPIVRVGGGVGVGAGGGGAAGFGTIAVPKIA
jgi:hypothetical protein